MKNVRNSEEVLEIQGGVHIMWSQSLSRLQPQLGVLDHFALKLMPRMHTSSDLDVLHVDEELTR
jgi:hypothetical protein